MTDQDTSENCQANQTEPAKLSARDIKPMVDDLFLLNPVIYWFDLLTSATLAYAGVWIYLSARPFSILQITSFVISGIALYRIAIFMHEIAHMRRGQMRTFKVIWNVLVGVPLLTPSLFYSTHADHHSNKHYGTPSDGEYFPFGATPPGSIIKFLAVVPIVPLLAVVRALILVPASLFIPRLRSWLLECASAAVISATYKRRHVPAIWDPLWMITDLACFSYAASIAFFVANGSISIGVIAMLYVLILFSIGLNWIRTLAAHRYRNDGTELDHTNQVLDSINITGVPMLVEFLFPIGLRYHALHHLLPSLPYHALGTADRRLMAELPANSPYLQIPRCGTISALRQLWHDAQSAGAIGVRIRQSWR